MDPFFTEQLLPALNRGLITSVFLIVPSAIMGLLGGILVGTLRVFGTPLTHRLMNMYTTVFRGVPLMVQLFILYYGLPNIHIFLEPYEAAVLGFTLCSAAYNSEYIRGALLSIREGQLKAAAALGMSRFKAVLWIVVPQAFRRALPGCGNEIIYLIKYSSLAYIITYIELTGEARAIAAKTFRFTEAFMLVSCYYLFLVTVASWLLKKFEEKLSIPGFGHQ